MLGFTQYSPAIVSLLMDRSVYKPLIMTNVVAASLKKLSDFLEEPDTRFKVVIFTCVDILVDVLEEGLDLQNCKVVIVDTISNLFKITSNVCDVKKRSNSFQLLSLTPTDLNQALKDCPLGVKDVKEQNPLDYEEITLKSKVVQRNLNNDTELNIIIQEAVNHLGNKEKGEASEGLLKFIAGIWNKKKLSLLAKTYTLSQESLKSVIEYVSSYKGKALRVAFMDVNLFHTEADVSLQETKANKLDFDYLTTYLPITNIYTFCLKPPKALIKKRGQTIVTESIPEEEKDELDKWEDELMVQE